MKTGSNGKCDEEIFIYSSHLTEYFCHDTVGQVSPVEVMNKLGPLVLLKVAACIISRKDASLPTRPHVFDFETDAFHHYIES